MLRRLLVFLVTVAALQVAMVCILPIIASDGSYANPVQYRDGDWIVTGTESFKNTTIILDGNLVVEAGGVLRLTNVILRMEQSSAGMYQILANPGSSLVISKSTIEPSQENYHFAFIVKAANFVLTESRLKGVGIPSGYNPGGGLMIYDTNGATLEENTINHGESYGINLTNSTNTIIRDNTITCTGPDATSGAISLDNSHNNTITYNHLYRQYVAIALQNSWNNYIAFNELTLTSETNGICLRWSSGNNTIAYNHISVHEGYEGKA